MDDIAALRAATAELAEAEALVLAKREQRDDLIIRLAMNTDLTLDEIAAEAGITLSGVWKVTKRNGITRQRVQSA